MRFKELVFGLLALCALVACGSDETVYDPVQPEQQVSAGQQEAVDEEPGPTREELIEDILRSTPVSSIDVGEFPYFSLPDGFRAGETVDYELTRAPFWVEDGLHWVNGRIHQVAIFAESGRTFSEMALRDDMHYLITTVGGVQIAEVDRIPTAQGVADGLDAHQRNKFRVGLGHFYSRPVRTYLLRVPDGDVWIHFTSFSNGASMMMAKAAPRIPTGRLLSGADLKTLIDMEGRAVVEVYFDVGAASLQPHALPQIEQIAELLRLDTGLRLSINGHTDSIGDPQRNLLLSRQRAETVVAALVGRGIAETRLKARGFGETEPVADNDTADGRLRNRRVELVPIEG